jgi:crotonobetaine/carnitine-CoA ligase
MHDLVALARTAGARWPDQTALIFDKTGETLSFGEFDRRTDAIARALVTAGIAPGDRVLVCCGNIPLFPLAWFGIIKAGAIMVPLNTAYRTEDARHLVDLAEPRAAFCDPERLALLNALAPDILTIVSGASLDAFIAEAEGPPPQVAITPDTLTNIQFTSGTSGLPKGCMLSHRYWFEVAHAVSASVIELSPRDTMLTAQAFSYLDPQWALVLCLMTGARLAVLERFRPSELWDKVVEHEASFFYCLAAMPLMLLSAPPTDAERRHRLRAVMCSAIPADRHAELEDRFAVPWVEAYGTTETGSDLGVSWAEHAATRGSGTLGRPLPHREARIVDGELVIRGPGMMQGYWRNPEATAEAFKDGWYHTGDLARQDAAGLFYLVGRRKDMIRRGGENIAAAEVEAALQAHPAVALAACIAVPDPIRNEEIKAFVIRSAAVTASELAQFLETRLARFKTPRYWAFVEEMPMTASERVAKPRLSRDVENGVVDLSGL